MLDGRAVGHPGDCSWLPSRNFRGPEIGELALVPATGGYAATIRHGIVLEQFPFDPVGSEDLLFFGRIHPDKGAAEAIEVSRRVNRRLVMAGIVQDEEYHERNVAPALAQSRVVYHGPVGGIQRTQTLGAARALLHLINFDEPFGLSVIEALACGTPVIARNRGSMPELIEHGVTGFLVDGLDAAVEAVERIDEIDRAACRAAVAARFTVDHMVERYLSLYRELIGASARAAKHESSPPSGGLVPKWDYLRLNTLEVDRRALACCAEPDMWKYVPTDAARFSGRLIFAPTS